MLPWIGGVSGVHAFLEDPKWRAGFSKSVQDLLARHPRFAGIHLNVEPVPSGNLAFLTVLKELRQALPPGVILSVAAYPPTTWLHPYSDVHWDRDYFTQVGWIADQLVVMMYDTALPNPKPYRFLMRRWTRQVLEWEGRADILLGIPAYEDAGVGWHRPDVENIRNGLFGVHEGLAAFPSLPPRYQGVALYSEWEMSPDKWAEFADLFLLKGDGSPPGAKQ